MEAVQEADILLDIYTFTGSTWVINVLPILGKFEGIGQIRIKDNLRLRHLGQGIVSGLPTKNASGHVNLKIDSATVKLSFGEGHWMVIARNAKGVAVWSNAPAANAIAAIPKK